VGVSNSTVLHISFYNDSSGFLGISIYNYFCIGSLFEIGCRHTKTIRGSVLAWVYWWCSSIWLEIESLNIHEMTLVLSNQVCSWVILQLPNGQMASAGWVFGPYGEWFSQKSYGNVKRYFFLQKGIAFLRIIMLFGKGILVVSKHLAWNIIIKYSPNDISFEQSGLILGYPSASQRPNAQCWVSVWAVCGMVFTKMIWQCEEVFFPQKGIAFKRITDVCLRRTRWRWGRCRWWTWGSSGTGGRWWRPLPRQPRHLMWTMRGMG